MPVYFIQVVPFGDVKIGVAGDPLARMRQLQTAIPKKLRIIRVVEGDEGVERTLHERFARSRLAGEWFSFSAEMMGDVGFADLPIPRGRREQGWRPDPTTAYGAFWFLIDDLMAALGGRDTIARALGVEPWHVNHDSCSNELLAGVIALARARGYLVSYQRALLMQRAATVEKAAEKTAAVALAVAAENRRMELYSLKEMAARETWWDLHNDQAAQVKTEPSISDDDPVAA